MIPDRLVRKSQNAMITVSLFVLFLSSTTTLNAQIPTNFSGKWEFDKTKSNLTKIDVSYDGTVILEIIQDPARITFAEIYRSAGSPDWKTSTDVYTLDGKEHSKKDDRGTRTKTAKWSPDKKFLAITNIDRQTAHGVTKEFIGLDTLTLSDNGRTLTIDKYYKNPVTGDMTAKKIYHKK
jgi:hypothetical protein